MPKEIVLYSVDHPGHLDGRIEVYGEPDMGWYEWRVIVGPLVKQDTGRDDGGLGRGYGTAAIALRDALNTEIPDPQRSGICAT